MPDPSEHGPEAARLVAVVVTHDRLTQLRRTVARLLEAPAEDLAALVVVDNASTDGTGDWLASQGDARLEVIALAGNRGGAGGFAAGMAAARARHDPDWIVVMDDDARPAPGAQELGACPGMVFAAGDVAAFGARVAAILEGRIDIGAYWRGARAPVTMPEHVTALARHYGWGPLPAAQLPR